MSAWWSWTPSSVMQGAGKDMLPLSCQVKSTVNLDSGVGEGSVMGPNVYGFGACDAVKVQ